MKRASIALAIAISPALGGCSEKPVESEDVAPQSSEISTRDPFSATCDGPGLTRAQALTHFAPAASRATLGAVNLVARQADCQEDTGCGPYTASTSIPLSPVGYSSSEGHFLRGPTTDYAVPRVADLVMTVDSTEHMSFFLDFGDGLALSARNAGEGLQDNDDQGPNSMIFQAGEVGSWLIPSVHWTSAEEFIGHTRDACIKLTSHGRVYHGPPGHFTSYEVVIDGVFDGASP